MVQKWLVKEGDLVEEFQNLADVSTDKLFTQIPSTDKGKVHKLHFKEGDACQVGSVLLELELEDSVSGGANEVLTQQKQTEQPAQSISSNKDTLLSNSGSEAGKSISTPVVRQYAKEQGVNIGLVRGTGPEGRVTKADVDSFKAGGGIQKRRHPPRIEIGVDMYEDLLATPAVRSLAEEQGVDINQVKVGWGDGRGLASTAGFSRRTC